MRALLPLLLTAGCTGGEPADDGPAGDDDDASPTDTMTPVVPTDTGAVAMLPACPGGVLALFDPAVMQPPDAGSEGYQPPADAALDALEASLRAFFDADATEAGAQASAAGYVACAGQGAEDGLAVWYPDAWGRGHAVVAVRTTQDALPLVVGVPHPSSESATLDEGLVVFTEASASALVAAGTHRCASSVLSGCDGTTSACGSSAPYPVSDAAHATATFYHRAHRVLADHFSASLVVSLRGMSEEGISLSDGTTTAARIDAPLIAAAAALETRFPDSLLTSCNDYAGADVQERTCETSDVNGRWVNGAADPCTAPAERSTGRFLNLVQDAAVRAQPSLVAQALAEVAAARR